MRHDVLFRNHHIYLARVDHAPGIPHRDPRREESQDHSISFVESGGFRLHRGRESWSLCHGSVLVMRPGLRYRCSHVSESPDDVCLSLHCSPELVQETASASPRRWDELPPMAAPTGRLLYLRRQLTGALEDGLGAMAVPPLVTEILHAVLGGGDPPWRHRAAQLSWYARRVDAARRVMEARFAEPLTVEQLGREVGLSTFHFARVFRELAGVPPHRYLLRVRLARAAVALREGMTVTEAALTSGFPSLSHFIRQFRRAHGVTPSRYGRWPSK